MNRNGSMNVWTWAGAMVAVLAVDAGLFGQIAGDGEVRRSEVGEMIQLSVSGTFDAAEATPIEIVDGDVELSGSIEADEFFGDQIINANARVNNGSDATLSGSYHAAFYDDENQLLGVASQSITDQLAIEPGDETQLGSMLVQIPAAAIEAATQYQLTFYYRVD